MSETKTKNLCTVPAADLTDSQYFIAEDGGELKRIPKAQVVLKKLENMLATDTENLAGGGEVTAQELLDALAKQVANKLLAKSQVVNNLLATVEGNPLDATQGKALKELIDTTNNNLSNTNSRLDTSLSSSVLDYALTLPEGMHTVRFPGDGYTGTDLPNSSYMYSSATISVRSTGKIATVLLFGISKNCPLAVNSCENGKWKGWDQYVTKDDLPIIGKFTNKKNKDIIKIGSVVKSRSVVCVFPRYNTLTTVRCIYPSLEISAGEDQFQLFAWDTNTQNDSTSTNLEGYYIVMPMLSK
jgi:hypothetical protein